MADGKVAEQLRKQVVNLNIVLLLNFSFEPVHLVELLRLMVASTHKEMLRQAHLPCKQRHDDFHSKRSSVNEVSVEHVRVLLRRVPIQLENIEQIIVLPMDVTADCDLLEVVDLYVYK